MKNRAKILVILLGIACLVISMNILSNEKLIDKVYDANSAYKDADAELESQNSDIWTKKLEEDAVAIEDLNTRFETAQVKNDELAERIKEINAEMASKGNGEVVEALTSDVMYSKLVNVGLSTGADIEKYYSYGDGKYTFTLSGKIKTIEKSLVEVNETLSDYVIDYGNISLRQNYDAYDLERTYDSGTMLDWYDNKIINALGETIELKDLLVESDENSKEIKYTVATLNDVKYDTEGYNMELLASNSSFESKLSSLTRNYADQLTIIEASEYSDDIKEEFRNHAEEDYERNIEALKIQKEAAAEAIKAKYDQKYEDEKNAVSHAIATYQGKIDELKKMLADSSSLEYTIDVTIRCK